MPGGGWPVAAAQGVPVLALIGNGHGLASYSMASGLIAPWIKVDVAVVADGISHHDMLGTCLHAVVAENAPW